MSPYEISCEAGSFSCCLNPHRCFQSEALSLYFPVLEPWVVRSVSLSVVPPGLSTHECGIAWSPSRWLASSPLRSGARLHPPTGLDECFFFNSLVVGLPYSSIFCQFWLFFVFKSSFFWLCKEVKGFYLWPHLGQNLKESAIGF